MTDIVERLRLQNDCLLGTGHDFSDVLLDAADEIERLRAHIAKLEAWQQEGEAMVGNAGMWVKDGNVAFPASTMFRLGAWWADRPWRRDVPDA